MRERRVRMHDYMQYLICYDTPSNRRRRLIVRVLEEVAERVQWSVFEGWMTPRQISALVCGLHEVVDPRQDNIRIYRLCSYCQEEVALLGVAEATKPVRYWIV